MAAGAIFGTLWAEPAAARATSKKWMKPRPQSALLRKSTIKLAVSSRCTKNFPSILDTNKCRIDSMKITRQIAADKIADYLHGKLSQTELVDWAERAMMDADFEGKDTEVLSDVIGRLGLADVAEFGLRWQDCEEFLRRLGYRARVIVSG